MSDHECYEALRPGFEAIEEGRLRQPDLPVDVVLHEAGIMVTAAREDAKLFCDAGFDTDKIEKLATAICALRHAQSSFIAQIGELDHAEKEWRERVESAVALRKELIAVGLYVFRSMPDAHAAVRAINRRPDRADLITDLRTLSELGKMHHSLLEAVNFDCTLLDAAETTAIELGAVHARTSLEHGVVNARKQRDRAFTLLRQLTSSLFNAARYVYRDNMDRFDLFKSSYRKKCRQNRKKEPKA